MSPFNRLPGFQRSPPGLEHRIWRRLPALLCWGTAIPIVLMSLGHVLTPNPPQAAAEAAAMRWDFAMLGVISLNWTLVLTLGIGCFIVRVMKGPAYVADAYPLPGDDDRLDAPPDRGHEPASRPW